MTPRTEALTIAAKRRPFSPIPLDRRSERRSDRDSEGAPVLRFEPRAARYHADHGRLGCKSGQREKPARMIYAADLELAQSTLAHKADALRRFAERVACIAGFVRRRAERLGSELGAAALDDIVQETYLALWRKLPDYRGESCLETWACGFAFHELRRWRERLARHTRLPLEETEEPVHETRGADDTAELVERALLRLGPPAEDVIRLKHFEDLTFETIGRRLDLSPNTAKSHYYRGLTRLREWLGKSGEELAG